MRTATAGETSGVDALVAELLADLEPRRGASVLVGSGLEVARPGFAEDAVADPERHVLVAAQGTRLGGCLFCRLAPGAASAPRGVIDACYVVPGERGSGVGNLLIEKALRWLAERGCDGVDGVAFPGDRQAKSFFEASGFKARLLVMHRDLD